MELSIVIPVYNEEAYIENYISKIIYSLYQHKLDYELIISENGSQDDTLIKAKKLAKRFKRLKVISSPHANYGLAVKTGFLSAKGTYLVLFDLDYYDIKFLSRSLPLMHSFDAVIGAKLGAGAKDTRPIMRQISTLLFSSILKLCFGMKVSDTHGIKILNRKRFLPLIEKCRMTKEIFDTELLIRGEHEGFNIGEIGVKVIEKRSSRTSIVKRALRTLRDLYKLKINLNREYGQM